MYRITNNKVQNHCLGLYYLQDNIHMCKNNCNLFLIYPILKASRAPMQMGRAP